MPFAYFLFVHFDRHIRADAPAEGAGRTLFPVLEDDEMVPFLVELLGEADALLRTNHDTELTPLAAFLIDHNLSHSKTRKSSVVKCEGKKLLVFCFYPWTLQPCPPI